MAAYDHRSFKKLYKTERYDNQICLDIIAHKSSNTTEIDDNTNNSTSHQQYDYGKIA